MYICTSPTVLSRVRAEIAAAIESGALPDPASISTNTPTHDLPQMPSYASITTPDTLPYLSACITEAMRLRPVTGMMLMRTVPHPGAVIEGLSLPAGTVVGVSAFALNHNPLIFGEDVEEFRPERWLESESGEDDKLDEDDEDGEDLKFGQDRNKKRHTKAAQRDWQRNNLNFGGPSRTCPGQSLARMVYMKAVVGLLGHVRFDIEGEGWKERAAEGFVARMKAVRVGVSVEPVVVVG